MRVLSFSEVGCVRKNNEDAFLALTDYGLYAVADGMGGHKSGEVAAHTALEEFRKLASELPKTSEDELEAWVTQALIQANREVYESSSRNPNNEGMGTTLTVLLVRGEAAVVAHVGDSRAYLWREGSLHPLTVDHSLVGELLRLGQISPEEAERHPQKHVLVRAVGAAEEIEVDTQKIELKPEDVLFLCTDGFSNIITEQEIAEEFLKSQSWEEHLERMRLLVLERGAPDNFTVLCCISE